MVTKTLENEELIEEAMRDVVLEKVDRDETVKADIGDPGFALTVLGPHDVFIYDIVTRERSKCRRNMLAQKLKARRPDGTPVFTTRKPLLPPKRGTVKCLLHPSDSNRATYDEMGLPTCSMDILASNYQRKEHMRKKHKQEWAAIEQIRIDTEKKEDRDFQKGLLRMVSGEKTVKEMPVETKTHVCEVCGKSFTKAVALIGHKRSHKKEVN